MLIVRSPLRISLGGGGTDLPSYYQHFGGYFISAAINKYVVVTLCPNLENHYVLKHETIEVASDIDLLTHPITKTLLQKYKCDVPLEISSSSNVPAGTGLGSSGAYTTALLKAVCLFQKAEIKSPSQLAEQACQVEMCDLQLPSGKQDPYVSSFGGLKSYEINHSGKVTAKPLLLSVDALQVLQDNLCLFFTGATRLSKDLLSDQDEKSKIKDKEMLNNLHFIKDLGYQCEAALTANQFERFGLLLSTHWEHKRKRSKGMSNPKIDEWYLHGINNGALGGKLIGAGGGGFLMFYAENKARLEKAMAEKGLRLMPFKFDFVGVTQVVLGL